MRIKTAVSLPVGIKLTPATHNMVPIAQACEKAGADFLTIANSVRSFAGVDIATGKPKLCAGWRMIDLKVNEKQLDRVVSLVKKRNIRIPTFQQQKNPLSVPEGVKDALKMEIPSTLSGVSTRIIALVNRDRHDSSFWAPASHDRSLLR